MDLIGSYIAPYIGPYVGPYVGPCVGPYFGPYSGPGLGQRPGPGQVVSKKQRIYGLTKKRRTDEEA